MTQPGPTPEPKWRRRADARPDEVLDAALDLFIDHGFAATRVEDIAKRAGLSKGAIYRYFSGKEAIMEALVRRSLVPIAVDAQAIGDQAGDARALITQLITQIGRRMSDRRLASIPRLILAEAGNFPGLAQMYRREVVDRGLAAMEALLKRGIASGQFRPVDAHLTVRNIMGPILAHLLLSQIFAIDADLEADPDRFIDNHLNVLFNGLAAKPKDT